MNASEFLNQQEKENVLAAIKAAEYNTSGEIRVHLEARCKDDVLDCAVRVFKKLRMHKTKERNGVLIYLSLENQKFAIIGDVGINTKVPSDFWNSTKDEMTELFKKNEFALGLAKGIYLSGEQLKKYFPYQTDDANELKDDISYGK